jgi:hypothetical protein
VADQDIHGLGEIIITMKMGVRFELS